MALQIVDALSRRPLPAAVVTVGEIGLVADTQGIVRLASRSSERIRIRANAAGYIERMTGLRLSPTSGAIELSLIPQSFDLASFNEGFRPGGALRRWRTNPILRVHTTAFIGVAGVAPELRLAGGSSCSADNFKTALADMTGGALTVAETIMLPRYPQDQTTPNYLPPGVSPPPQFLPGAITFFHGGCGGSSSGCGDNLPAPDGPISSGFIIVAPYTSCSFLRMDWLRHAVGHALGINDINGRPSVMNNSGTGTFTEADRHAVSIQYQRPLGNRSPDIDPEGFVLNAGS